MSRKVPELKGLKFSSRETLKVTLLGSEWTSSAGGLSTLNRELAIHLSQHPKVEISFLVPEGTCKAADKKEAQSFGITVVEAKERPGYNRLDWLSFPPQDLRVDVVVGHGVVLGRQGQVLRDSARIHNENCKWLQMVHTAPEELSKYKSYSDAISKGESKHEVEVILCKLADLVVPVGPELKEAYSAYLRRCKKDQDVFAITPGLFDREFGDLEQSPKESGKFKVLLCGRADDEDFELKGYSIAAKAFTNYRLKRKPFHLLFVGAHEGKQDEVREKLLHCGIAEEQLTVRQFVKSRERLKDLMCEVDLAIMPSKSEGFGLVSLEALSAGLPILVGSKSGFARAIENIPHGKSCIVDLDDPTEWAKAIEAARANHTKRLKEIKALRESYEEKYGWKQQCEALVEKMWTMVFGMGVLFNLLVLFHCKENLT